MNPKQVAPEQFPREDAAPPDLGDLRSSPRIITIGHGTTPQDEFAQLLHQAGVQHLVDVRTAPGSRRNPQFAKDALAQWLPENDIGYRWEQRLGGWRKLAPDSPDIAVRHPSFRAYAGHMRTPEFRAGIADLLALAQQHTAVAIMCSETVWWRCHRRMIADYLVLIEKIAVLDLLPGTRSGTKHPVAKLTAHPPMPAARVHAGEYPDDYLFYDGTDPE